MAEGNAGGRHHEQLVGDVRQRKPTGRGYDYRFGYDLLLTEENSIERKLYNYGQAEWEDEEYEP